MTAAIEFSCSATRAVDRIEELTSPAPAAAPGDTPREASGDTPDTPPSLGGRPVREDDLAAHLLAEAHATGWGEITDLVRVFARSLVADFHITK